MKNRSAVPADEGRHLERSAARDLTAEPHEAADGDAATPPPAGPADPADLTGLSIAGITRRRVGWVAAGLLSVWIVIVFARQVGDAAAASTRAAQLAEDNAALAAEVRSLQAEVELIVRPEYVSIQARAYGLGAPHEIPFRLSGSVPAPVDGAPGSASVRLGASVDRQTPLESWLSMLFGPSS